MEIMNTVYLHIKDSIDLMRSGFKKVALVVTADPEYRKKIGMQ